MKNAIRQKDSLQRCKAVVIGKRSKLYRRHLAGVSRMVRTSLRVSVQVITTASDKTQSEVLCYTITA